MYSILKRAVWFGAFSGLIWAALVGGISGYFNWLGEGITVLFAGALTGIVVSLFLIFPLRRYGRGTAIAAGLFALPLGGFCFGVIFSTTQFVVHDLGGPSYRYVEYGWYPLKAGGEFAVLAMISIFGLLFFPLSLLTTYCLRRYIRSIPNYA